MPFSKWSVEPVFLSRKPLPPDKKQEIGEFDRTVNLSLANCLRQLASVAKIADRIFVEIASECHLISERTEKLMGKISVVQNVVDTLNARAVKVPQSDLSETAKLLRKEKPFVSKQYDMKQTTQLFLPSTRPPCVDALYQGACTSPVAVMCTIDHYRTDGLSASELFMVTPVLGGTRKKKRKLLDIETRKPANFSLVKPKQDRIECGSSSLPVSPSRGFFLKQNAELELERLPSPEEQAMLVSLEFPSTLVPVDTSERSFNRMTAMRRSLIHADFEIKRKKNKRKSKRRHTICEGENREIEKALRNVTNTSCQTDDDLLTSDSSFATIRSSFLTRRRSKSVQDNSRRKTLEDLDSFKNLDSKDSATEEDKSPTKSNTATIKKSKSSSLRSRAYNFNPISTLSAALVKMRSKTNKQDDGRSSSGNWSASSSTRASVTDSDQVAPLDGVSSPSRNSVGKDSVLSSDHQDPHNRSRDDDILPIQSLTCSPVKQRRYPHGWDASNGRHSNTPTPDHTSQCSSTPLIRSPYTGRRGISDDGDSSVYSVDTDGYYTSMHTDSGLWTNVLPMVKAEDILANFRMRQESQSSVDNSSINSFLSKSATEFSSNSDSLKSVEKVVQDKPEEKETTKANESDKSYSPQPANGSTSESDHEDRIRAKTVISANRYPSMCAVSPETSDDESSTLKKKDPVQNVNVIVAEVHREESIGDSSRQDPKTVSINNSQTDNQQVPKFSHSLSSTSSSSINMYRSETPLPSSFSAAISQPQPISCSTPRPGVTTFSPELSHSPTRVRAKSPSLSISTFSSQGEEQLIVTQEPTSPLVKNKSSLIPLKYAQRITVTPIARSTPPSTPTRSPLFQHSAKDLISSIKDKPIIRCANKGDGLPTYISFKAPDSPVSSVTSVPQSTCDKQVSSPTNSLNRPVARVTLDPSGKVVYSSNSLERPGNPRPNTPLDTVPKSYATMPMYHANNNENKPMNIAKNDPVRSTISSKDNSCERDSPSKGTQNSNVAEQLENQNANISSFKSNSNSDFTFRPTRGGRFCRSYFPSHLISNNSGRGGHQSSSNRVSASQDNCNISSSLLNNNNSQRYQPRKSSDVPEVQSNQNSHSNSHPSISVPNSQRVVTNRTLPPNDSKIWPKRTYFPYNHNEESFRLSSEPNSTSQYSPTSSKPSLSSFKSLSPPDLIPCGESPPSTLDITSPANSSKNFESGLPQNSNEPANLSTKENLKSLSATELFAIIHSSKKKHNIKTESEKSISPLSSRSVSPALSQSSISKLQPIERGVLSRRSDSSLDKSKWCNSLPSPTLSQRLNPPEKISSKPTSMRDFKMLLLQTRTGSPAGNSRPSAAELLKVSPPKNSPTSSSKVPLASSNFKTPPSYFNSGVNYSPGHGSSKRTLRTRSPYLSRYDSAYPPIIEDCLEETESYENNTDCLMSSLDSYRTSANQATTVKPAPAKATSTWV